MTLTRYPHGIMATPNIGGANNFAGWWGREVFFVDNEAGSNGDGSMDGPFKYLEDAISGSASWDTIYVRPRTPDNVGGDPQAITPNTVANWSIPNSKNGIQIIGCGVGRNPLATAYQTRLQGHASVTGTAPITVLGSYCNIENLSIKRGGATGVPLINFYTTSATVSGHGSSIFNCRLHMGNGTSASTGAIQCESYWYLVIENNLFDRCSRAIGISSSISEPCGVRITGNTFANIAADNYGDISSTGGTVRILIDNNIFQCAIPSNAGGSGDYINFGAASTGAVTHNFFATATLVTATIWTLNGVLDGGGNWTNRGWMTS